MLATTHVLSPLLSSPRATALKPLPCPASLVCSTDDSFRTPVRAFATAAGWVADAVCQGDSGLIRGSSRLGDWRGGLGWQPRATAAAL